MASGFQKPLKPRNTLNTRIAQILDCYLDEVTESINAVLARVVYLSSKPATRDRRFVYLPKKIVYLNKKPTMHNAPWAFLITA